MPKFLHAYCGLAPRQRTTRAFASHDWEEVRMDPDAGVKPDVLGDFLDLSGFADACFDAIFTARSLERLYPHEVESALAGCLRLLSPDGYVVIVGTDIEEACARVAQGKAMEKVYDSPAGPVTALDILYGFRPALAAGRHEYACRSGLTAHSLATSLTRAGYPAVWTSRNPAAFTLTAIASKKVRSRDELMGIAKEHFN